MCRQSIKCGGGSNRGFTHHPLDKQLFSQSFWWSRRHSWTPPRSLTGPPEGTGPLLMGMNSSSKTVCAAGAQDLLQKHAVSQEGCLWVFSGRLGGEGRFGCSPGKGSPLQDHGKCALSLLSGVAQSGLALCTERNQAGVQGAVVELSDGHGQFRASKVLHFGVSYSLASPHHGQEDNINLSLKHLPLPMPLSGKSHLHSSGPCCALQKPPFPLPDRG